MTIFVSTKIKTLSNAPLIDNNISWHMLRYGETIPAGIAILNLLVVPAIV